MSDKKKIGRPTKYNDEILNKAKSYVSHCQDKEKIPYIEELALILDINDDTIVEWTKKHKEFSATIDQLKTLQKLRIKDGALTKQLHPSTSMFLLRANHGVSDRRYDKPENVEFVITL